jgi:protein-S-isoprenylcysteine O-methyltransferase Ste14
MSLQSKVIFQCTANLCAAAAILFIPAGTLDYWQAWIFLGITFVPMVVLCVYFYKHDPALLERRLRRREKEREQRLIMRAAMIVSALGFLVPGLDHRFGWTRRWMGGIPEWAEIAAQAVALAGYLGTAWVIDVNRFASRTIEVEEGQKVISSGPYGVVRHPLYASALVFWVAAPFALGTLVGLPFFLLLIPVFVLRILNEEKVLLRDLPGYEEYRQKTRYHLVPYVW